MYVLYLDDSGSVPNRNEGYFVLGGVCLHETQIHWVTEQLNSLAAEIDQSHPENIEFHASEEFSRRAEPWTKFATRDEARGFIKSVLRVFTNTNYPARAFACAIHKPTYNGDPFLGAFEDLFSRFDQFLAGEAADGERQRGLIVLDDSDYENVAQTLGNQFRQGGTRWGNVRFIAETPLFTDSRSSRIIQLADHIAYSVFRRYNQGDTSYFDVFATRFHNVDGVYHGLAHIHRDNLPCPCIACQSRRNK